MGVVRPRSGSVIFDDADVTGKPSHAIALAGMPLVHEERRIFGSLNVEENLVLAGLTALKKWPLARIYDMFPRPKERRTSRRPTLSCGEQHIAAIGPQLALYPQNLLPRPPSIGP